MKRDIDTAAARRIEFSNRLRMVLTQRGYAPVPAQLARDFVFSTSERRATAQTFSNWLNGVQMPLSVTLHALAEWLHTTPEFLAEGVPLLHFAPPARLDIEQTQLLEHFQACDAYGRRVALVLLAGLARLKATS